MQQTDYNAAGISWAEAACSSRCTGDGLLMLEWREQVIHQQQPAAASLVWLSGFWVMIQVIHFNVHCLTLSRVVDLFIDFISGCS
jgi:hypothetical protein